MASQALKTFKSGAVQAADRINYVKWRTIIYTFFWSYLYNRVKNKIVFLFFYFKANCCMFVEVSKF